MSMKQRWYIYPSYIHIVFYIIIVLYIIIVFYIIINTYKNI